MVADMYVPRLPSSRLPAGPSGSARGTYLMGSPAEDRLLALTEIARAATGAVALTDVLERTAAAARDAVQAGSISIAVWERDQARVRVLLNHGDLGPREERYPVDEVYRISDVPFVLPREAEPAGYVQTTDDDPTAPGFTPAIADLLVDLEKHSCLGVPIILEGRVWGEFFAARDADALPYLPSDLPYAHAVAAQVAAAISQVRHLERVAALAYTDPLTGLGNRRAIDDRLDQLMDKHREDDTVASLIVVDVNGLKRINDEYGHEAGDRALVHFAGLLSASAGLLDNSLAGRTGGDEFCIIVEGYDADAAVAVAEDLCRRARVSLDEGIACGVASTGDPVGVVDTAARLFRLADAAQTRAKRSRTPRPVVAGRGLPLDATVRLANSAERSPRGASARGRADRRRVRGQRPVQDGLLGHVLTTLDHSGSVSIQSRLEVVADAVCRSLDACSWWVSRTTDDVQLATLSHSFVRVGEGPKIVPDIVLAGSPTYALDDYPLSRRMIDGGGQVVLADDPVADPAEVALLTGGGYTGLVLAGGRDAVGRGWLVEVYTDDLCGDVTGIDDVLRALVAAALIGPPRTSLGAVAPAPPARS